MRFINHKSRKQCPRFERSINLIFPRNHYYSYFIAPEAEKERFMEMELKSTHTPVYICIILYCFVLLHSIILQYIILYYE